MNPAIERRQIDRVTELRTGRDSAAWAARLSDLEKAARAADNLMPHIIACCAAKATVGEISDVLRKVFGEYRES